MRSILTAVAFLISIVILQGCDHHKPALELPKPDDGLAMVKDFSDGFSGVVSLANKTFNNLSIQGAANLHDVVVLHDAKISGICTGDHVKFNGRLRVNGDVTLANATVTESTEINGVLTASATSFHTITVTLPKSDKTSKDSPCISLCECTTSSIELKQTDLTRESVLELDHTTVDGDITFVQGHGQVIMRNGAAITGQVSGGIVRAG